MYLYSFLYTFVFNLHHILFQGGEGKMSSPVWQFQMGDPEALNAAEPRVSFITLQNGGSLTTVLFTAATMIVQILMARIL